MKREIKFRGKRIDNNEWIEGYYGYKELTYEHFIIVPTFDAHSDRNPQYFSDIIVDGKTVSQYTGLIDMNNKEIYEGDILGHKKYGLLLVKFISGKFVCDDIDLGDIHEWTEVLGSTYDQLKEPTPE